MGDDMWYDDDVEFESYDNEEMDFWSEEQETLTFDQLITDCLIPTYSDAVSPLTKLFLSCGLLRFFIIIGCVPHAVLHVISIAIGSWLAVQFFQLATVYLLVFTLLAYAVMTFVRVYLKEKVGYYVAVFAVVYSLFCELVISDERRWHAVRGANMIIVMKVVSLSFDTDNNSQFFLPPFLQYLSYCSAPSTIAFGPWVSYSDYLKTLCGKQEESLWWIVKFVKSVVYSLICLSVSTCWSHWLFGYSGRSTLSKWIVAYGDALSYRCSHYFISYVSEGATSMVGFKYDLKVSEPLTVEFPRSLVDVVIHWNYPMHFWLKTYVFRVVRAHGTILAIFSTYAVSSLLHGLNFQLAAVLFSLGFHTFVEYELRRKLSDIFSACVMARKCRNNCHHLLKSHNRWVFVTNVSFSLLALFHLTYLGLMFDSNPSVEEKGYDMSHTLRKWGELGYASHWLALFTFVFHKLL